MKILMIDALVGSDYSDCLCSALKDAGTDITLIVPANKRTNPSINFPILKWSPSKQYKGLDLLLDAFEIASQDNKNLKLVIAGSLDSEQLKNKYVYKINQLKSKNNIIQNFTYIPTEKVANYFIAADIIALPYKNIYHSGIIHLAFSFGRPFIATDVGDFKEMSDAGKCGKISPENTAASFAETILDCFVNKTRLEAMGKYCKKTSETKYSWNDIAIKTRDLYKDILSR